MFERDLLVALIALGLGSFMVFAAVSNYERAFEMRTPKFLVNQFGLGIARLIVGGIGTLVVLMGIYILIDSSAIHQKFQRSSSAAPRLQLDVAAS